MMWGQLRSKQGCLLNKSERNSAWGGLDPCQSICAAGAGSWEGAATSTTPRLTLGFSLPGGKGQGAGPRGVKWEGSEGRGQSYLPSTCCIPGSTRALRAWPQEPVPSLCRCGAGLREAESSEQSRTVKG